MDSAEAFKEPGSNNVRCHIIGTICVVINGPRWNYAYVLDYQSAQ